MVVLKTVGFVLSLLVEPLLWAIVLMLGVGLEAHAWALSFWDRRNGGRHENQ